MGDLPLSGAPDVVFLDIILRRLFVASGKPGSIDVIDIGTDRPAGVVHTELGAHTMGFDPIRHRIYALLPGSHCARAYDA